MSETKATQRAWSAPRGTRVKRRQHSNGTIDGHYVSADIDEFSCRWYVGGAMFGFRCSLHGELPDGATIADLRAKAEDALRIAREGGLKP